MQIMEGLAASSSWLSNSTEEEKKLCEELEKQELDAPGGIASGPIYLKLLALYLLQNDLCNAKYLWKRTPQSVKLSTPELNFIWNVGQKMWLRDFPGIYAALKQEWSEGIAPIMQKLTESTRGKALHLISNAYSSINLDDFSGLVGLPLDQSIQLAQKCGWTVDHASKMVAPLKSVNGFSMKNIKQFVGDRAPPPVCSTASEEQLIKLTEFVSFLEN